MIILLVTITCFILYRAGAFKRFLAALKTAPDDTPKTYQDPPDGREKWENEARYILARQGQNPDTVPLMGNELLKRIIRDYLEI